MMKRKNFHLLGLVIALLLLIPQITAAVPYTSKRKLLQGSHGDSRLLPQSCRACHRGMSIAISGEEGVCLNCHGSTGARQAMTQYGLLKEGASLADLEREFRKPYRHPAFEVSGVHQQNERLPEELVDAARHSECVDCHNPHLTEKGNLFRGLRGKRVGNLITDIAEEFELCYRCHAESPNLPTYSTNKHAEFKPTNPSFHPVEAEGKNLFVISLKEPYVPRQENPGDLSMLSCSSCHGNDNAAGPQGPHGSIYPGLLKVAYEMGDERPEGESAYALCYSCHSRTSILSNESFPYHALHIEGNRSGNSGGTSCYTCHDAHGSSEYQYLIRFNRDVVLQNADGKLEFQAQGVASRSGSCLLNCHGVEHNPKSY